MDQLCLIQLEGKLDIVHSQWLIYNASIASFKLSALQFSIEENSSTCLSYERLTRTEFLFILAPTERLHLFETCISVLDQHLSRSKVKHVR